MHAERRSILFLAGLFGLGGTAAAAAAAHLDASQNLTIVSTFLLLHGAALPGILALASRTASPALLMRAASVLLALGVLLFCSDLLWRDFMFDRLFPGAAPIGGMAIMAGWASLALSALAHRD